ncbi:MAG: hypothetical protein QOH61_2680 [Chloroflexota bacterium]|jgi:hypothetical protein|nr:hypothetical protein [Chloroflexota bacterium]
MTTDDSAARRAADLTDDERAELERLEAEELMGAREVDRLEAVFPVEGVDTLGSMTDTRIYEGELEARTPDSDQPDEPLEQNLEFLEATELRAEETDDPAEAAEEGMTWVPPTDPPVVSTSEGDLEMGAGFGTTSLDEPFDADHHSELMWGEDEVTARVREALRADSLASQYADDLHIDTDGSVVRVSGIVDDLEDEEQILAVISEIDGVTDIRNRLRVLGLE